MDQAEPANQTLLTAFFAHNTWANLTLLDFCEGLSDEQLATTAIGAYGSIRSTLQHYISSEVDYVNILTGKWPEVVPNDNKFAGFATLKDSARWAGAALLEASLTAQPHDIVHV